MESKLVLLYSLFLFTVFSFLALAQTPGDIGDWYGTVTVNGSSSTDGATVEAFISGALVATDVVGTPDSGYYLIHVPGSTGDTVTFKVYGVEVFEGTQNWSSSLNHELNLTMNKTANGANCTYNDGCTSNNCASDYDGTGKWCVPANYCAHNNVTYANGATVCSDSSTKQTCSNGNWSSSICTYGCSGGACSSAPSPGPSPGPGPSPDVTTTTTTTAILITTTTIPVEEIGTITEIQANGSANITFEKEDELGIQEIEISVKNDVANVSITLKETTKPEEATVAIGSDVGDVYKYLSIEKTNIEDEDISEVKLKFKVEKSWLTANNIDPDTILLKRLVDGSWEELPTAKVSEDDTYYYYEAISTGFSYFAITGEKTLPVCGNNIKEAGEECDGTDLAGETCVSLGYTSGTLACTDCTFDTSNCTSAIDYTLLYLIIIAIVIVGFYLFIRGRKKKHHPRL